MPRYSRHFLWLITSLISWILRENVCIGIDFRLGNRPCPLTIAGAKRAEACTVCSIYRACCSLKIKKAMTLANQFLSPFEVDSIFERLPGKNHVCIPSDPCSSQRIKIGKSIHIITFPGVGFRTYQIHLTSPKRLEVYDTVRFPKLGCLCEVFG